MRRRVLPVLPLLFASASRPEASTGTSFPPDAMASVFSLLIPFRCNRRSCRCLLSFSSASPKPSSICRRTSLSAPDLSFGEFSVIPPRTCTLLFREFSLISQATPALKKILAYLRSFVNPEFCSGMCQVIIGTFSYLLMSVYFLYFQIIIQELLPPSFLSFFSRTLFQRLFSMLSASRPGAAYGA